MNIPSDAHPQDTFSSPENLVNPPKIEKFNLVMGYHAAAIFLDRLWFKNEGKFSENDLLFLSDFCSYLEGDPASICDWGRSYLLYLGEIGEEEFISGAVPYKNSLRFKPISPLDAFQILKIDCQVHLNNYGFEFHDLPKDAIQLQLESYRDHTARLMKNRHTFQAKQERYIFSLVTQFYNKIRVFEALLSHEAFLSEKASLLAARKLIVKPPPVVDLTGKDREIVDEVMSLFLSKDIEEMKWKLMLKTIGARIKEKMLNHWALEFYAETQERFSESVGHLLVQQQTIYQELAEAHSGLMGDHFLSFARIIEDMQRKIFEELGASTEVLYTEKRREWDAYLDPSGSGLMQYLRTITHARLLGL